MNETETKFSDSTERTSTEKEDDERAVLASINAAVFDQAVYEDNVIRQASYQSVPQLSDTVPGFPSVMENELLLPLLQHCEIPASVVLHSILDSIQAEQRTVDDSSRGDMLRVKEQIILKLLGTASVFDVDGNDNGHRHRNKTLVGFKNQPEEAQTRRSAEKNASRTRRIPMMKRKRMEIGDEKIESATSNGVHSDFTPQKVEELKALRALRRKNHQERYLRNQKHRFESIQNDCNGSSDEFEMDNAKVLQPVSESLVATIDDADSDDNSRTGETFKTSVSCPLCQNCIEVDSKEDPDAALALHISDCQNSRSSRRRKPASSRASDVERRSDMDESSDARFETTQPKRNRRVKSLRRDEEDSESVGSTTIRGNDVRPEVSENNVKLGSSPIDDIDEWNYEDRVDDWILNGIQRMKVMKERDESEILPGDVEFEGGLLVPEWINNHLFSYQREGVEWMWNLHQQSLGGIIGDEMGLVCCSFN
jgi:hypothetical protein